MLEEQDMQLGREALLEDLATYKKKTAHRITVVFDAADAPSFMQHQDRVKGISVKFSNPGETADTMIKRMSRQFREKALVVSSDRDVAHGSAQNGAATIGSPEFEEKMSRTVYQDGPWDENTASGWKPTTKKKGPSRRLPKKTRKNLSKLRKL